MGYVHLHLFSDSKGIRLVKTCCRMQISWQLP